VTPGGDCAGRAITAAWAAMRYLGQAGCQELTRQSLAATATLRAGLDTIPGPGQAETRSQTKMSVSPGAIALPAPRSP
jgi:glutamate/tyrosine decarboxylase-like PLP-dependent enzyme